MASSHIVPLYNKLPDHSRRIRLLTILPNAEQSAIVECTLAETNLDDNQTIYDALSYCWGDPKVTRPAIVNGHWKQITTNLDDALRQFRSDYCPDAMILWADALCINQDDTEERERQVPLMGDIYKGASAVHAWLGRGSLLHKQGLEVINRWSQCACNNKSMHYEYCCDSEMIFSSSATPEFLQDLHVLSSVSQIQYWDRLWVVQELVLNDNVLLHCGPYSNTVHCWHRLLMAITRGLTSDVRLPSSVANPSWISGQTLGPSFSLARQAECKIGCPSSRRGRSQILGVLGVFSLAKQFATAPHDPPSSETHVVASFAFVVVDLCLKKTTDPRDRIYALRGLLPRYLHIAVDYSKSAPEVFEEATIHIMQESRSADVLQFAVSGNSDLPTWVPNFGSSKHAVYYPLAHKNECVLQKYVSAAQRRVSRARPGLLMLKGRLLGTVEKVQVLSSDGSRNRFLRSRIPPGLASASMARLFDSCGQDGDKAMLDQRLHETFNAKCVFAVSTGYGGLTCDILPQVGDSIFVFALPSRRFFCLRDADSSIQLTYSLVGTCTLSKGSALEDDISPLTALREVVKTQFGGNWSADGLFHPVLLV